MLGGILVGYVAKMSPVVKTYSDYLWIASFLLAILVVALRVNRLPSGSKKARWFNYSLALTGFGIGLLIFPA
jgi:hypothetical protein